MNCCTRPTIIVLWSHKMYDLRLRVVAVEAADAPLSVGNQDRRHIWLEGTIEA